MKRPYYRLRGKRVTEEQAFEIILRTDEDSPWRQKLMRKECFWVMNFKNRWTHKELFYYCPHGWVNPNGIVGVNDNIIYQNAELVDLIDDCLTLISNFPYLDFVVAITSWDDRPPYILALEDRYNHHYDEYPDFLDNIDIGLWVHDGTIEVMSPERTAIVYSEYDKKYSEKDHRIYCPEYYMDFQPDVISDDFVARCYKACGFDGIPETSEWFTEILTSIL